MYAKIAALTVLAALFANGAVRRITSLAALSEPAPQILLVPGAVGSWKQTAQWLYPLGMGQFQEYGQYASAGWLATMSFDHNRVVPHSAIGCFTIKMGALESSAVVALPTLEGSARFNMGRFSDGPSRAVVAASQCFAGGCIENPPAAAWSDMSGLSFWRNLMFPPRYEAIPLNVSIEVDPAQPRSVSDADLDHAMADFIAHLDLHPVRDRAMLEARATP